LISNHFGESVSGPEKAGVGGSIPSLATNTFNNLATAKKSEKISRAYNTRTSVASHFTFGAARSNDLSHFPRCVAVGDNQCCSRARIGKEEKTLTQSCSLRLSD
jgi:hypothetical protein